MEIGHIIAQLRTSRQMSQRALAKEINVSAGVIGLWETNKRVPSFECIIALADYFSISTDVLFEKDRNLSPAEYESTLQLAPEAKKILNTFNQLNPDNQDILIGKSKELLREQRLEEKRGIDTLPHAQ